MPSKDTGHKGFSSWKALPKQILRLRKNLYEDLPKQRPELLYYALKLMRLHSWKRCQITQAELLHLHTVRTNQNALKVEDQKFQAIFHKRL